MGFMMPAMLSRYFAGGGKPEPRQPETPQTFSCPECQSAIPGNAKFCPACGHQLIVFNQCANCGKNLTPNAKFCSRCGHPSEETPQPRFCSKCGSENLPESSFCNQCGEKF